MRKVFAIVLTAAMMMTVVTGCAAAGGQSQADVQTDVQTDTGSADVTADTEAESGAQTGMINPWKSITEEDSYSYCDHLIKVPDGAENITWSANDSFEDKAMVEVSFSDENGFYIVRAIAGTGDDPDTELAGAYYEWTDVSDHDLANWCDKATVYTYIGEAESVEVCTWYDPDFDVSYSVMTSAPDLDGFDISAFADGLYNADK